MGASTPQSRAGLVSKKQRRKGQTPLGAPSQPPESSADLMDSSAKVAKYAYPKASDTLFSYGSGIADTARLGSTDKEPGAGILTAGHSSLADPDPSQLWRQINECLDGLCGKTVVEQLLEKGHSELLAQRACLEVFHSRKHVNLEAAEDWICTQGPTAPNLDELRSDLRLWLMLDCGSIKTLSRKNVSPNHELVKPEDRSRYQDIALAVAKVACLYSNASKEASREATTAPLETSCAHLTSGSFSLPPESGSPKVKITSSTCVSPGSPRAGTGTSAKKALKLLKAAGGKEGCIRAGSRQGEGLSPQVLLQALPPQVWTSLQDSAGEVLQAMASAVDRAMDHPGLSSSVDTPSMTSSGPGSTNVTCIAMPVPLSGPLPSEAQAHNMTAQLSSSHGPAPASPRLPQTPPTHLSAGTSHPAAATTTGAQKGAVDAPKPAEERLADLTAYKSWAEAKIALLIQRVRDAERARREEAARTAAEASQLRKM